MGCTLTVLERLSEAFDIGLYRMFMLDESGFDDLLTMEDSLVCDVLPFLRKLTPDQRVYILKVLNAAPKTTRFGRPRK